MKNLLCSHPAIILNPHLKDYILLHKNYTFRGNHVDLTDGMVAKWRFEFPYGNFGTKRYKISYDDISNCYITDFITGELIPMYYEVPCGKCSLCCDKSARDWSTRAMCESQTSTGYPLFVTLTYNPRHLPSDGVVKEHAQNFMKRLRININRYMHKDVNLRFFLCAEYGSKHGRPHYHALIWNFPILENLTKTLRIFEKSWSYVISKDDIPTHRDDYCFYDEYARRWRCQYGFVHLQHAQGGHVKYCMKYMRKDAKVPKGANDVFFLSSRRRGLGFAWFESHYSEYCHNPKLTDVQFTDIWSSAAYKAAMPKYFKTLLYPTISRIIPKDVRDKVKTYCELINMRNAYIGKKMIYSDEVPILTKFSHLFPSICDLALKNYVRGAEITMRDEYCNYIPHIHRRKEIDEDGFIRVYDDLVRVSRENMPCPDTSNEKTDIIFKSIIKQLSSIHADLKNYHYEPSLYEDIKNRNNIRLYWIGKIMDSKPDISVVDAQAQIYRRRIRQLANEIF